MKKIRLSESELISLIKKIIKETDEDMSTEYKERKSNNALIQNLGTKTYLDIIKGQKHSLFSKILEDKHIKISTPDEEWYQDNIDNLKYVKNTLKSSKGSISWRDGDNLTFQEKIDYLIKKCQNKEYVGFIEENEDRKVWSLLNKIDTNYSNWESMINDRLMRKEEGGIDALSRRESIEKFFKQRPLSEIFSPARYINFKEYEKTLNTKITTISYAELDLLEAFGKKNSEKLESIFSKIRFTTKIGDELELKFLTHLRNSEKPDLKIVDFSSPGSVVDTALGIDCMIYINGEWCAVQIKGGKSGKDSAKTAFIHSLGINSISIYETNNDFYYYTPTKMNGENNFNEDFGF
jgi:hypothetical protein